MPINKTINFLPSVFQSEANQKFLNATIDQLTTEPNLIPINGYVGRKFAPGFKDISSYIREPSLNRADYQLEPTVVVKNKTTGEVEFSATYPETLQKVAFYGGNVSDPNRLFSSEYYSYNPYINLDAYINFGQYYWLPDGPQAVDVFAGTVPLTETYYPQIDLVNNTYTFNGYGNISNPDITLARGGVYTFNINTPGKPFWIQTDPGISGRQLTNNNLSSRQILGVTNNGTDNGTVTFAVPNRDAQDFYVDMPVVQNVDLVTTLSYATLQGAMLSTITANYGGIDGQRNNLNNKFLIFGQAYDDEADWTSGATTVAAAQRYGIWQIQLTASGSDFIIGLVYYTDIPLNNKVIIQSGVNYGNTQWYKFSGGNLLQVPVISADLNTLYYQNGDSPAGVGVIKLVDSVSDNIIDVTTEILGKQNYISPNGVTFTNGLKIRFDNSVTPAIYQNKEYYVDGVGQSIVLTAVADLLVNAASSKANFDPTTAFGSLAQANLNASRDQLTITSNVVPSSASILTGTFPNSANPNYIVEQDVVLVYPSRGGLDEQGDHASKILESETLGVTVVGIPINGATNDWTVPGDNGTTWHYDASTVLINGQDSYGGYPTKDGKYSYRNSNFITANAWGSVTGFTSGYTNVDGHSKIIGYAADGYPIYGPFGYSNPADASSSVVRMRSSYSSSASAQNRPGAQTVTVTANCINGNTLTVSSTFGLNPGMRVTSNSAGLPQNTYWIINNGRATATGPEAYTEGTNQVTLNTNVTLFANTTITFEFLSGSFIEDYVYTPNSGTLDQYNGRYCVTPEFPAGTYAYFATQDSTGKPVYPYFIGSAFYGSEQIDINTSLTTPDYLIINRSSRDLNPWSRRNRWFHQDVIQAASQYNRTPFLLDQNYRAKRPIIEFIPNLQLYDFGKRGIQPVDIFDTVITQPFLQVEGVTSIFIDGVNVVEGMRIIFSADQDPTTRNKIWIVNFIDPDGLATTQPVIHLVEATGPAVEANDTVSVFNGVTNAGKSFWFNGTEWNEGQTKTTVNQAPLFDVFDTDGDSLGNRTKYPINNDATAFNGTKIFSYKEGTGVNDPVLGFPLTYKNFNNIGDIQFDNNFDIQTFTYTIDKVDYTKNINLGYLYQNNQDGTVTKLNTWEKVVENTKQYQDISYIYDGIGNQFQIDVTPVDNTVVPNLLVFVNYKQIPASAYRIYNLPLDKKDIWVDPSYIKEGDKIDILVYSLGVSAKGYYEVPDNLNYNAQNLPLISPTLGEMRNHIGKLTQNSLIFSGAYPGNSNLRDIEVVAQGGTILQQSAPTSYGSMFLCSENYNFVNSVLFAQQEYTRFKNKLLTLAAASSSGAAASPVALLDAILIQINEIKNQTFPFYYSDMVPYGKNINKITYSVFDPAKRNYEITEIFSLKNLSNKSVLVYKNFEQLLHGYHYVFLENAPGIQFTADTVFAVNDRIDIIEYQNTDANYIPETPTKLGLYPKFKPEIYVDETYLEPQTFIRGHDGSLTPAFGDFRDNLLLELEKRIYNNIKVEYSDKLVNIFDSKPGKFRKTSYTIQQFNNLVARGFLPWIGLNKLDYATNSSFDLSDSRTFNYSNAQDVIDGELLPGSWRACFEYFYDTQRPHTHPWEMLGFSEMPDWWESTYGPAPYTSGNKILWDDLEAGYIAAGERAGIDTRFARPGLSNIIPVNVNGELQMPLGLLTQKYYQQDFGNRWKVGQWSPTETAWRNSSDYPFAVQIVAATANPATYFSYGIATNKYRYNTDVNQYLVTDTNQRLTQADIVVNGNTDTGTIDRAAGYLNWITEYRVGLGITNRTITADFTKSYDLQLAYRMAGYSSKDRLKVLAEQNSPNSVNQSVIIPDENYSLVVNKSTPVATLTYSAVIVEKTANGFTISGYDNNKPYFLITPPMLTGQKKEIRVLNSGVSYYFDFLKTQTIVPYGTELTSVQQVASFLAAYEKSLTTQGFRFDYFDTDLGLIRDWQLSTKEFLFWNQQNWPAGSVIVLGPFADRVKVVCGNYTIDEISNTFYGTKVMNQNYLTLDSDAYSVQRDSTNNTFRLQMQSTNGDMVAFINLNAVQYEHILIFDNRTQFNDVIFEPAQGQRQFRLKLVGVKTGGWTGTLSAEGFVYNGPTVKPWLEDTDYLRGDLVEYKNFYYAAKDDIVGGPSFNQTEWLPVDKNAIKTGLLPGFSALAGQAVDYYDTDLVNLENTFDQYSLGLIGYRNRDYLDDLGLNDTSQVKFYQGFIKEKGTRNAIDALGRISFNNQASEVTVNEEWAFRVGAYGSLDTNQFIELVLNEDYVLSNPTSMEVTSDNSVVYSSVYNDQNGIYKTAKSPWSEPIFLNRNKNSNYSEDIQTAGFVNIEDVDYTIFDFSSLETLTATDLSQIGVGDTIWCAKDYNQSWNVYRVNSTPSNLVKFTNALDRRLLAETDTLHGLSANDIIIINSIEEFSGFYRVDLVNTATTFTVTYTGPLSLNGFNSRTFSSSPIYKLVSQRYDYASQISSQTPAGGWEVGDKVWINYNNTDKEWAVYNKTEPWEIAGPLPRSVFDTNGRFGSTVKLSYDNNFALVGEPGTVGGVGSITNYVLSFDNTLVEDISVSSVAGNVTASTQAGSLGFSVDSGKNYIVAGAPTSAGNIGYAFVYSRNFQGTISQTQILAPNTNSAVKFGYSVTISEDDQWVYVGAPDGDRVYVYGYKSDVPAANTTISANGIGSTYGLTFVPERAELLAVSDADAGRDYVPYVEYTVSGSNIVFNQVPPAGDIIIRQNPGFVYVDTLQSANAGSKFGYSVASSTDGRQVIVGSPMDDPIVGNVAQTNAGTISVYDRSVDKYIAIEGQYLFGGIRPVLSLSKVYVADTLQTEGVDYIVVATSWVQLTTPPGAGVIVTIETDEFNLIETTAAASPQQLSQFGFDVDICPNNCSIYVGAPYYNGGNGLFQVGSVYRFTNQGRIYGNITGRNIVSPIATVATTATAPTANITVVNSANLAVGMNVVTAANISSSLKIASINGNVVTLTGNISGSVNSGSQIQFSRVTSGDTIRINDYVVELVNTTIDEIVSAINVQTLPGITAENRDGYLHITSDSVVSADKLRILPSTGTALTDLGLDVFVQTEQIANPTSNPYDYFGHTLAIDSSASILAVGSPNATTLQDTTFDIYADLNTNSENIYGTDYVNNSRGPRSVSQTTFDAGSTQFIDAVQSGAVWMMSYLGDSRNDLDHPGNFNYIEQLTPAKLDFSLVPGVEFGYSIDIKNYQLLVGTPGDSSFVSDGGRAYLFNNDEQLNGWDALRVEEPRVDIQSIIKSYIYNAKDQTILYNLDYIDPAKGKILGIAEQDITYKTDYDPAVYNNTTNTELSSSSTFHWNNSQVGDVWWDLSAVRYLDYEQGSVKYRTTNWGRTFPGSRIDVYEWVESLYPPSQYVANGGNGTPKYPNNSAYVTLAYVDPATNQTVVKYYFWVKDKTTVEANLTDRETPVSVIADYIANPKGTGIKYFAAVRDDAVAVYNVLGIPSGQDIIMHIDYATILNSNIIHSEYALLPESDVNPDSIPRNIYAKLVDSASGLDVFGNPVPDPALPVQSRYGIDIRPRQGMFVDKNKAIEEMVTYVNNVFANNIISQGFDLTTLSEGEAIPASAAKIRITVNGVELTNTQYSIAVGMYNSVITFANTITENSVLGIGFNDSEQLFTIGEDTNTFTFNGYLTAYTYNTTVDTIEELGYINIIVQPAGYRVLVLNDSSVGNLWTIYVKLANNTWQLDRVQKYLTSDYWEYIDWYAPGVNSGTIPKYTVGVFGDMTKLRLKSGDIVKVLNNGQGKWTLQQVFPNTTLTIGLQDGTIALKESLYNAEEYGLSFGTDNFDGGRFDQNPSIEIRKILEALRDDIFVNRLSQDFLNLFYVFVYYVLDEQKYVDWVFKTSFINVIHKIRGLDQPQIYARENQDYYKKYIEEVKPYHTTIREYVIDYQGVDNVNLYTSDFDVPAYYDPVLQMYRSPSGEFVEDTRALQGLPYRDWMTTYPYVIGEIIVTDPGSGYTIAPNVTITGSSIGNNALARALITDGAVSKIEVIYPGSNYITQPVVTLSGGNGTGARAYAILENTTTRKIKTTLVYDRITYGSEVLQWEPNTSYAQGDIIAYNNIAYIANRNFTSGATFVGNDLTVYNASNFDAANDRIAAYYSPSTGMPGKNYGMLQNGIDYPGVTVEGPLYTESGGFDVANFDSTPFDPLEIDSDGTFVISSSLLDTEITSSYTDLTLGTRPEDIIIDGSPYVYANYTEWQPNTSYVKGDVITYNNRGYYIVDDFVSDASFDTSYLANYDLGPYASHAPEELVPGRIFDTLDMTVYTFATDPTASSYDTWVATTGFEVVEIPIIDGGSGYNANTVSVTISGTTGAGAAASVDLDANGSIVAISVVSSGIGYTTVPNVIITGSNTSPARASVRLYQSDYGTFEYRMFKSLNNLYINANTSYGDTADTYTFYRIDQNATTTLAANLNFADTVITVTDSSVLAIPNPSEAIPGVIFIDGERITYYAKDDTTNTLSQIRRGTAGTGAKVHLAGAEVVDASLRQVVPYSTTTTYIPSSQELAETTSGSIFAFNAGVPYVRTNLWYSTGSVATDLILEAFVANTVANVITTESSISISTDNGFPSPAAGTGLYNSTTIQATFIKDA